MPGVADLQIYGEQAKVFTIDVDQNKLALARPDRRRHPDGARLDRLRYRRRHHQRRQPEHLGARARRRHHARRFREHHHQRQDPARRRRDAWCSGRRTRRAASTPTASRASASASSAPRSPTPCRSPRASTRPSTQLQQTLPKGVDIKISSDDSIFISGALHEVERSLGLAVVIVIARHLPVPDGLARDARAGHLDAGGADRRRSPASTSPASRSTS